jgi:photosystem II stability/assembly factor-like uncharacterized protein
MTMLTLYLNKPWLLLVFPLTMILMGCIASDKVDPGYVPQVQSAAYYGAGNAWLITLGGDLLKTHDGGGNWETLQGNSFGRFNSVSFIDERNGWINTKDGQVLRTTDGGRNWTSIAKLGDSNYGVGRITFIDEKHGWMVNTLRFSRTEDGGITWQHYQSPKGPGKSVFHCYFINPKVGWLSGTGGAFYRTEDGGNTWEEKTVVNGDKDLSEVSFVDSLVGWVAARPHQGIYRTDDGGKNWVLLQGINNALDLVSVHFINESVGWVVGADIEKEGPDRKPIVLQTMDGGKTWERVRVGEDELLLHSVYFVDVTHGWILARDNVYHTSDGGKNWHVVLRLPSLKSMP